MTPERGREDEILAAIGKIFYKATRGKTVTPEQAYILAWAEQRVQYRLAAYVANRAQAASEKGFLLGVEAGRDMAHGTMRGKTWEQAKADIFARRPDIKAAYDADVDKKEQNHD